MVTPYLVFNGNCKEVLEFYKMVFNSEIKTFMQYGEYIPEGSESPPPDLNSWVLHAEMQICGTNFWFADEIIRSAKGNIVRLSATVPSKKEAQKIFERLAEYAEISVPPTETFYSTFHAALTDKYGIGWNIVAEESPNTKE
jgi:PhnB protein